MKLTHSIVLDLPKKDILLLGSKSSEAAKCWNCAVSLATYAWKEYGIWLSNFDIQKFLTGNKFNLHSNIIQGLTDKLHANRVMTTQNHKQGLKHKYPYKTKYYFCLPLKKSNFKKVDDTLRISLAKGEYIYIPFPDDLTDIPSYGEITFKNGHYVFYYCVEVEEAEQVESDTKMGIDLGEIHSISAITNNGDALIITNRLGRSFKRYRNKQKRKLQKKMSKCKKGSNRYKKLARAKKRLQTKTGNKLKNLYHHTTKKAVQFAKEHNVSEIVCGNCKGVERNTKKKKRLNKNTRQKIAQLEYGTLIDQLTYKSKLNGIEFVLAKESYTSQKCPKCSALHKMNGRTYKCRDCGYTVHRDINGAWNILNQNYTFDIPLFKLIGIHPIKCIS